MNKKQSKKGDGAASHPISAAGDGGVIRVLIVVSGMSPAVITETVYALATESPRWVPHRILVITTEVGREQTINALFDGERGRFAQLCREQALGEVEFGPDTILVPSINGAAVKDVVDEATSKEMGNLIVRVIAEQTAIENTQVHVSIAGGRKTMSYFAGQALTMLGRPADAISHVLVNKPFEGHPEFFFKPIAPVTLTYRDVNGKSLFKSTSTAEIRLAKIPFLPLRKHLPTDIVEGAKDYELLLSAAKLAFNGGKKMRIDVASGLVHCGNATVRPEPSTLAFLLALARTREADGGTFRRHATDQDVERFLSAYRSVVPGAYLSFKHAGSDSDNVAIRGAAGVLYPYRKDRRLSEAVSKSDIDRKFLFEARGKYFSPRRSRWNRSVDQVLGSVLAPPYSIYSVGDARGTQFVFSPELSIEVVNDAPSED